MDYQKQLDLAYELDKLQEKIKTQGYELIWDFSRSEKIKLYRCGNIIGSYNFSNLEVKLESLLDYLY